MNVRVNKPTKIHIKLNISRNRLYMLWFQFYKSGFCEKLFLVYRTYGNKLPDASTVNIYLTTVHHWDV